MGEARRKMLDKLVKLEGEGLWLVAESHAEGELLRRLRTQGEVVSPCRGVYARAESYRAATCRIRTYRLIRALGRAHPTWVFCCYSAAVMHGLQVPYALLDKVHVISTGNDGADGRIARHDMHAEGGEVTSIFGVRVTSLRKTLIDCLCASTFSQGLPIADSALHWGLVGKEEMIGWLHEDGRRRRGVRQARETAAWADGRSENGGESVARATMIELGFEVPELQVELFDPMEPNNPKRGDFGWRLNDGRWIIGELDGLEKYRGRGGTAGAVDAAIRAMARERRREAHINLTNATVVRFSMDEVRDTSYFERLLASAGVPRRLEPSVRIGT